MELGGIKFYSLHIGEDNNEVAIDLDEFMLKNLVDSAYCITKSISIIESVLNELVESSASSKDERWDLLYPRCSLVKDLDVLQKRINKIKAKSKTKQKKKA